MLTLAFALLSIPGISILYLSMNRFLLGEDKKEKWFLSFSFYFIIVSLISLVLVIFGTYSIGKLLIALLVLLILFFIANLKFKWINLTPKNIKGNIKKSKNDLTVSNFLFVALTVGGFFLYVLFPTEFVIGGRDQGVYVSEAVLISETGGLQYEDEYISKNYDSLDNVVSLGYPGFYAAIHSGMEGAPGKMVPQFMPMFPGVLAVGYDLLGLDGLFRINAVIGILAVLSIFFFARELIGSKTAAFLSALLIMINPAEIWNARITQTELLSQFLFFFSMHLFLLAYKKNKSLLVYASGFILGLGCFNRVDSYLFGLGVFALIAYMALFNRTRLKLGLQFAAIYAIISGLSVAYGFVFSYPYYHDLWLRGSLKMLLMANLLMLVIGLVAIVIRPLIKLNLYRCRSFIKVLPALVTGFLFVLFLLAYFIRPHLLDPAYDSNSYEHFQYYSMREFTWYVPIVALLFAFVGFHALLKKKSVQLTGLFLVVSLASIVGYIYAPNITPDHLWASRRWITISIPAFLMFAGYGLTQSFQISSISRRRKASAGFVGLCIVAIFIATYSGYQSKPFLFQPMLHDYGKQFQQLADQFPDDSIILSKVWEITTPLKFVFDKNAYTLKKENMDERQLAEFLKNYPSQVYSINWTPPIGSMITAKEVLSQTITGQYPPESRGSFPQWTADKNFEIVVYQLTPGKNDDFTFNIKGQFKTSNGQFDSNGLLTSNGTGGFLLYGPYMDLAAGEFKISFDGSLMNDYPEDKLGFVDVVSDLGSTIIERVPLTKDLDSIGFSIDQKIENFEFRIYLNDGVVYQIRSVRLQTIGNS